MPQIPEQDWSDDISDSTGNGAWAHQVHTLTDYMGHEVMEIVESLSLDNLEQRFLMNENPDDLARLLDYMIQARKYDIAQQYIDLALLKKWDVWSYLVALHLAQGEIKKAFLQIIFMLQHDRTVQDITTGIHSIISTISLIIQTTKAAQADLRIFASFIYLYLRYNDVSADSEAILQHWNQVSIMCTKYEWIELHEHITDTIGVIVWKQGDPSPDLSVQILRMHADCMHQLLLDALQQAQEKKDVEAIWKTTKLLNDFCTMTWTMFRAFPDTEELLVKWVEAMAFNPLENTVHKTFGLLH